MAVLTSAPARHPTRHAAHHCQISDQHRQLRAELPGGFLRDRRTRAFATLRTYHTMALILDYLRLDVGNLCDLMPLHSADGLRFLNRRSQSMPAVLALLRQDRSNLIYSFSGHQWPMRSAMSGLPAHFPSALLAPAALSRLACQSIRRRRLGGVCGILLAQRQLPFQIRDLLLGIRDLLLFLGDLFRLFGQLLAQLLNFAAQALILTAQCLAFRRWTPLAARSSMWGSQRILNI